MNRKKTVQTTSLWKLEFPRYNDWKLLIATIKYLTWSPVNPIQAGLYFVPESEGEWGTLQSRWGYLNETWRVYSACPKLFPLRSTKWTDDFILVCLSSQLFSSASYARLGFLWETLFLCYVGDYFNLFNLSDAPELRWCPAGSERISYWFMPTILLNLE